MKKMRMETTCKEGVSAKTSVRMADGIDLIIKGTNMDIKWSTEVHVEKEKVTITVELKDGEIEDVARALQCMGFKEVSDIDISDTRIIVS